MKVRIKPIVKSLYECNDNFSVQIKRWYGWATIYRCVSIARCINYVRELEDIMEVERVKFE